jgi:hypothetical protein
LGYDSTPHYGVQTYSINYCNQLGRRHPIPAQLRSLSTFSGFSSLSLGVSYCIPQDKSSSTSATCQLTGPETHLVCTTKNLCRVWRPVRGPECGHLPRTRRDGMSSFGFDSPSLAGARRVWVIGIDHARRTFSLDSRVRMSCVSTRTFPVVTHRVAHGTAITVAQSRVRIRMPKSPDCPL